MTEPITIALEIIAPTVEVSPDADGNQVVLVATPGPQGPPGAPGDGTRVIGETPTGTQNGTNTVFTLASTPAAGTTALYRNGLRERLSVGYTVSGSNITFTTAPLSSDELVVDYEIA